MSSEPTARQVAYLAGFPTRSELLEVVLAANTIAITQMEVIVAMLDGQDPDALRSAAQSLNEPLDRLSVLMRAILSAGPEPDDHADRFA